MERFLELLISGILVGSVYSLVAIGFVVFYKSTQVFNFAQVGILVLGAFVAYQFMYIWGLSAWVGIPLTLVVSILLGLVLERLITRPLIGQPIISVVVVTLAVMLGLRAFTLLVWGGYPHRISQQPFLPAGTWEIGSVAIEQRMFVVLVVAMALIGLLMLFYNYTRAGLGIRVTQEDHVLAESLGIRVRRVFQYSWIIGSVTGTTAGILVGATSGVVQAIEGYGLIAIAAVIFGGLESLGGAFIAGMIVGVIQNLAVGYITFVGGDISLVVPFLFMVLVMMFRPYGLFGLKQIERV